MKSVFIALGLALVLFLYGYLFSVVGHDHSAHERKGVLGEHHHDHSH